MGELGIEKAGAFSPYIQQQVINNKKLNTVNKFSNPIENDSFKKSIRSDVTNESNNGHISVLDKAKCFGKGLISPVTSMLGSVKGFVTGAAIAAGGAALCIATGGAAVPLLVAAGIGMGGYQLTKGAYKAATAKTTEEAREAWEEIGAGTSAIGLSALGAKASLKSAGTSVTGITEAEVNNLSVIDAIGKNISSSIDSTKISWQTIKGKSGGNVSSTASPSVNRASKTAASPKTETPPQSEKPKVNSDSASKKASAETQKSSTVNNFDKVFKEKNMDSMQFLNDVIKPENFVADGGEVNFYKIPVKGMENYGVRVLKSSKGSRDITVMDKKKFDLATYKGEYKPENNAFADNLNVSAKVGTIGDSVEIVKFVEGNPLGIGKHINELLKNINKSRLYHLKELEGECGANQNLWQKILYGKIKQFEKNPQLDKLSDLTDADLAPFSAKAKISLTERYNIYNSNMQREEIIKIINNYESFSKNYNDSVSKIADLPQSSFDDAIKTVIQLQKQNIRLDCHHGNNILLDPATQKLGFVDLQYDNKWHSVANIDDFTKALLGGNRDNIFRGKYAVTDEANKELPAHIKTLVAKIQTAAKNNNVNWDSSNILKWTNTAQ